MISQELAHQLRGPFTFLRQDPEELRRLVPDAPRLLPMPQRIWLEKEAATPLLGFPVLVGREMQALATALEEHLVLEEAAQVALLRRQSVDTKLLALRWERYRALLARALENATLSSYGRHYPGIFWLYHSRAIARLLRSTPQRAARIDSAIGREHGDHIKYRVFYRYLDRVLTLTYDLVNRVAGETDEAEEELFPAVLTRMRDNVLVFTEDHVSPDLAELGGYFTGYLRIDGRDLRARLEALAAWQAAELARDPDLRELVAYATGAPAADGGRALLHRPGWVGYLATRQGYDPKRLLGSDQVSVWENLLVKLKEFELLHSLRRMVVPLQHEDGALVCTDPDVTRVLARPRVVVSAMTRPLDFMAPWVVDPQVSRCGMIYDITDFTELISVHRRGSIEQQDGAFRAMFRFQRKINRVASAHRLKLEKYLGDGAFFSSRDARHMLVVAIKVQRAYAEALREGFPFDRGMRIAMNYGQYRLIPVQGSQAQQSERYEFFGHGVIEVSRLVTGKSSREVDEIKNLLVSHGYAEASVERFFAPLTQKNLDLVDKQAEKRGFYAYINQNGTLVNEGIVATGAFLARLESDGPFPRFFRLRDGDRTFVVVGVEDGPDEILVGFRKLGLASLKGLDRVAVYEVIDLTESERTTVEPVAATDLLAAIEREFHDVFARSNPRVASGPQPRLPPALGRSGLG